ncbi:MAG: glycosyl hydrolase-related protein [Victivallaceae bacterium]|nr:glycosyl hydrolase-related protein [Victivallaceae bacterium]
MKKYRAHLIAHTHWDREWYHSMELYRFRLIEVVERLKTILTSEQCSPSFFFDGQTIPFEEYLEVRPDDEAFFLEQVKSGRLHIGPFYLLMDEQLVNGESYLRNLMLGLRTVKKYGGNATVGYMPDNFGHISQTPQIFAGFGIDNIVMWRGFAIDETTPTETWWEGADGTRIKAALLLRGYSSCAGADPATPDSFDRSFESIKVLKQHATTDTILLMHGIDHSFPHQDMEKIVEMLDAEDNEVAVTLSDFANYLNDVPWAELPCLLHNELIKVLHMDGTFSSRLHLKQLNRLCETRLIYHAEPLAALAWLNGERYPEADIRRTWKKLIQSQPHDSITGCHADRVAQDMETRLASTAEMADYLGRNSFDQLGGGKFDYQNPVEAKVIALFNPMPSERETVIRTEIFLPHDQDYVKELFISDGNQLYQADIIATEKSCFPQRSDYMIPQRIPVTRVTIEFGPIKLASFSVTNFQYEVDEHPQLADNLMDLVNTESKLASSRQEQIYHPGQILENRYYIITVKPDATIDVKDKLTGKEYKNLHALEAEVDAGNLYNFAPLPVRTKYCFIPGSTTILENFTNSASIQISGHLELPAGLADNIKPLKETVACPVEVVVTLKKNDPIIYFNTKLENRAENIIIRARFDTELENAVNRTHTPFDIVTRKPLAENYAVAGARLMATSLSRYCAQYFTSVANNDHGVTLLNRGLPEYTFHTDGQLSLTLLRSTNMIWGYSEVDFPTHDYPAQGGFELGSHEREYAIMLHAGDIITTGMVQQAVGYNQVPCLRLGIAPVKTPFTMKLLPETMLMSAFKRAEDGAGIILRFHNLEASQQTAELLFDGCVTEIIKCRLDETPLEALAFENGCLTTPVKPKEISTLKIQFKRLNA